MRDYSFNFFARVSLPIARKVEKLNVAERLRLFVQSLASGKPSGCAGSASSYRRLPFHDHRSTRALSFLSVLLFAIPVVISSSMFLRMPK
jgi:hypothetical protein